MSIMPPDSDSKLDPPLRHCYCVCQWEASTHVAMCGHSQTDEPRWVDGLPADACPACTDLMWSRCNACGAEPIR